MDNNSTPLWLDLKKEYIDDNFEKLLPYLREAGKNKDSFYEKTIDLMRQRVRLLVDDIAQRTLPTDEEVIEKREFNVRLLAAWLLVGAEDDSHRIFLAMLGELRHLVPKFSEELLDTALQALRFEKVSDPGLKWDDIMHFSSEIFTYKVINQHKFIVPRMKERWWSGMGSVCQTKDCLWLSSDTEEKAQKVLESMSVCIDEPHGIKVLPAGKEKLKQSLQNDFTALSDFVDTFIDEIKRKGPKKKTAKRLLSYSEGDEVTVRVVGVQGNTVTVETTNPSYNRLIGPLVFSMSSVLYYYKEMFAKWLKKGYFIPVHVKSMADQSFTLEKTFVDFIVTDCEEHDLGGDAVLSKLIDTSQRQYVWINQNGIPIYTDKDSDYMKGSFAMVQATESGSGNLRGKITGEIIEPSDETFYENEVRDFCIQAFCYNSGDDGEPEAEEKPASGLDSVVIGLLARQLFAHQKLLMKPSERIKLLAIARILSEMTSDIAASEYIEFANSYLRSLVMFSRDEDLSSVKLKLPTGCEDSASALKRIAVVQLLRQWGKDGDEEELIRYAKDFEETDPALSRIARIIQTSNSMQEIVTGASINVLKREIIKVLQLETTSEGDVESENGIYLGVESGSVEFKESVVYPPNYNMMPNETMQIRNILKGICAFLNSPSGGTLYLGVSDHGYVKGIQNDLDYLRISTDTYMRVHIQDPAKQLLGLDAIAYMRMELMYDEQVVAIHVDPHPYRIVELEGKAYLRINAESREMSDFMRQQMLSKKVFTHQELAANLSLLQQSMQNQKVAVLHRYASSNSGTVQDRIVEAYDIYPDSNIVVCLDLKDKKCKCFNLSRIGYVEIKDDPWANKALHSPIKVDAFHMSGDKQITCCLDLDLMAYNLLCEEYPKAKEDATKAKDENHWILNAKVYNVAGIGRFVVGLANHISIIDAPELKEYIREYSRTCLELITK